MFYVLPCEGSSGIVGVNDEIVVYDTDDKTFDFVRVSDLLLYVTKIKFPYAINIPTDKDLCGRKYVTVESTQYKKLCNGELQILTVGGILEYTQAILEDIGIQGVCHLGLTYYKGRFRNGNGFKPVVLLQVHVNKLGKHGSNIISIGDDIVVYTGLIVLKDKAYEFKYRDGDFVLFKLNYLDGLRFEFVSNLVSYSAVFDTKDFSYIKGNLDGFRDVSDDFDNKVKYYRRKVLLG